eukprot:CAMPEP_0173089368 /NCGR_PEP_ID=MMETSP1102-20130122/25852_1 /TAXON_ID=49646 /ORGANISM="Geminigera sp., Strain Caron Lab Isolate" /LENGTH=369 /DNA_ID=CAMNT_0013973177 /DNA_START=67 /DNA_END=1175 /DNA_ORIENTATION=-
MKIGAGASRLLPEVLRQLKCSQPLLVTDTFVHKTGLMKPTEGALKEAGISYHIFHGAVPDPTADSLVPALELLKRTPKIDCVVGFGGGSSLDTAKALAVLARHPGPMRRHKVPSEAPLGLPVLAIPTTAGTGSEVTRFAIVTDSETQEKMLCLGPGLLPAAALVDFELTMNKPMRLTADSGLDSLCHALEAYVSRKSNPFTDALALTAMSTISQCLRTACFQPSDRSAREQLMLASTQAGIAFSNASVTLIHGMSRPIGAHFHVPHGLSNAMLLPSITAFSLPGAPQRYAQASRAMGFADASTSDAKANIAANGWAFDDDSRPASADYEPGTNDPKLKDRRQVAWPAVGCCLNDRTTSDVYSPCLAKSN